MSEQNWNVLVTGGAGYVGSSLVPRLLEAGHAVTVLDLFMFGDHIFSELRDHPRFRSVKGDLRSAETVADALQGIDAVIHLACISNDPSFELNPELGKSINYNAFRPLVRAAKDAGAKRFVYASSSSVYGIKNEPDVTEDLALEPLTDYSRFKALCEEELDAEREPGFIGTTIRPATVCGYAPRQRLDVVVNILTNYAVNTGRIRVFGGRQKRPNIHINDMVDLYLHLLDQPDEVIDGGIYNAGYHNHTLMEIADIVKRVVGPEIGVDVEPTDDERSYHISSAKLQREIGFVPKHTIEDAVRDLTDAMRKGLLPDSMSDPRYFNIKTMQEIGMS